MPCAAMPLLPALSPMQALKRKLAARKAFVPWGGGKFVPLKLKVRLSAALFCLQRLSAHVRCASRMWHACHELELASPPAVFHAVPCHAPAKQAPLKEPLPTLEEPASSAAAAAAAAEPAVVLPPGVEPLVLWEPPEGVEGQPVRVDDMLTQVGGCLLICLICLGLWNGHEVAMEWASMVLRSMCCCMPRSMPPCRHHPAAVAARLRLRQHQAPAIMPLLA